MQCKCRVVNKSLAFQKCVTSPRPRNLPGLIRITDYISYINYVAFTARKSGSEPGGAAVLCKFDRCML